MYSQQDLFFSSALAVYIAVSVVVAVVRWGHRCEPYARNMDYYHPAWRTVVFCFLTNLLLLPFVYMPHDTDSNLALRIILMLASPYFSAMFMFTYFGRMLKRKSWIMPLIFLSVPFTVMTLLALAIAIEPGQQLVGRDARILGSISGTLAFIFLYAFGSALYMIGQARRRFSETNFSNPDDFPKDFARQAVYMAGWHVVISWFCCFQQSNTVMGWGLFVLSGILVCFLIADLQPHRALDANRLEAEVNARASAEDAARQAFETSELEEEETLSTLRKDEILRIIRHAVEDDKAFLDSHLTLSSLARSCGVNRTYVSAVMNEYLGGFFAYVNRCRLDYAAKYKSENPDAAVEELATASGFGSRQSFYNARKQLSA
jgi:AraC-like DNA-binding protein